MTLNQTIKRLQDIVVEHGQINSYYFGELSNWSSFPNLVYPSCLITLNDATITTPRTELNFSMWVTDRLTFDNTNSNEVMSDTLQVMNDLLAAIDDTAINWLPNFEGKPVVFFEDSRNNDNADVVGGVKIDFTIGINTPKDRCAMPTRTRNYIITETGLVIIGEAGIGLIPE